MKKNVGKLDSTIRYIAAILIAIAVFLDIIPQKYGIGVLIIAVLIAISAYRKVCFLYKPFKIKTCKDE